MRSRVNLAGKVRIFELAKEVGLTSKELTALFNDRLGGVFEAKNQLSVVPDQIADLVRAVLLKPTEKVPAKPVAAAAPAPAPPAKPQPKAAPPPPVVRLRPVTGASPRTAAPRRRRARPNRQQRNHRRRSRCHGGNARNRRRLLRPSQFLSYDQCPRGNPLWFGGKRRPRRPELPRHLGRAAACRVVRASRRGREKSCPAREAKLPHRCALPSRASYRRHDVQAETDRFVR